jgi:hypothetical protein
MQSTLDYKALNNILYPVCPFFYKQPKNVHSYIIPIIVPDALSVASPSIFVSFC